MIEKMAGPMPSLQHDLRSPAAQKRQDDPYLEVAKAFEASFLAEMLKHSGVNKTRSEFGGGAGEDAFSSLLTQKYADKLAEAGGIGLAQHIYNALKQKDGTS